MSFSPFAVYGSLAYCGSWCTLEEVLLRKLRNFTRSLTGSGSFKTVFVIPSWSHPEVWDKDGKWKVPWLVQEVQFAMYGTNKSQETAASNMDDQCKINERQSLCSIKYERHCLLQNLPLHNEETEWVGQKWRKFTCWTGANKKLLWSLSLEKCHYSICLSFCTRTVVRVHGSY